MFRTTLARGKVHYNCGCFLEHNSYSEQVEREQRIGGRRGIDSFGRSTSVIRTQVTREDGREFYKFPLSALQNMKLMFILTES